jgi:pyruvate/2-oxoglutarate dehydrogenase complex dihydrolipoamide acyltransferase (E2) component
MTEDTGHLVDIVVPKWGMTMDSATVETWHKEIGDPVEVDEAIADLETDKTVNEVLSQVSGVLVERLAGEGDEVEPGDVLARVRPTSA